MDIRQRLIDLGIGVGEQVPLTLLNQLLDLEEHNTFYYPPTPGEILSGKVILQGKIKEPSDGISKLVAILNSAIDKALPLAQLLNKQKVIEDLYAPTSTLCLCMTPIGIALLFKNKKRSIGWDLPGGTIGWDGEQVGLLSQIQRASIHDKVMCQEMMQETGVKIVDLKPWFVHQSTSKINHRYVVYLAKGEKVADQRKEDKDCSVIFKGLEDVRRALASPLGNKQFVATRMITDQDTISQYFTVK
jgi:hypothetical protein